LSSVEKNGQIPSIFHSGGSLDTIIVQSGARKPQELRFLSQEQKQEIVDNMSREQWELVSWKDKPMGAPGTLTGWIAGKFGKDTAKAPDDFLSLLKPAAFSSGGPCW